MVFERYNYVGTFKILEKRDESGTVHASTYLINHGVSQIEFSLNSGGPKSCA